MRSTAGAISTVAGSGGVFSGDGVSATTTELYNPNAVAFDLSGNLLIADSRNFRIRKVDGGGTISTIVGTGVNGTSPDGTLGSSAQINFMNDITVDAAGNLYLVGGNRVRKVNASDGKINTIAGNGSAGFSDNIPAVTAMMNNPNGIALDAAGNIYIADTNNNRVRKVTIADGNITTIAGNGTQGANGDNGPATSAQLSGPRKVAVDSAGNVYIADNGNNRIRRVAASDQTITTFSTFGGVSVSISGGSIYIASFSSIQQIFPDSTLMTVGGLGFGIYGDNGPALTASLANTGIGISPSGSVYVADAADNVVRKMNPVGGGFAVLSVTPVSINNRFGNLSTSGVTTETIALNGTGVFSWTATSSVNSFPGSEWLSLSADSGTAGAPLFVTVNPAGLAPGFYNGSVTITSPQAVNGSVVVPVTMTVLSSTLSVIPTVISASTNVNGANPAQQNITVTNGGSGPPFGYNAAAVVLTPQGGSWLTVSPGSGTTAATPITAFFNVTGLGSGIYSGQIRLTSAQADNSAVVIPVTLTINPTAAPTLTSVSPSSGAPGQLVTVTLTGTNFAPSGNTIAIDGTGVTSGIATLMSGTSLIATFTISSGATAADHNVTVSTANGSSGSVTFTVGLAKRMRSQLTSVP
jgi:sugar lactone lactonase YvrE